MKKEKSASNIFLVRHALKIIIHQLRICKQKTTKISPFEAHFDRKPNTLPSVIATKPKLSNLTFENIVNHYLDEDAATPEPILPDDKCVNGYRSDMEVEIGMNSAARKASQREQAQTASTDGESRFLHTNTCRSTPLTERAVKLELARKVHGKRMSKKNLKSLFEMFVPGSNILKVSPTTSTIKGPGKPTLTIGKSDIAKFGTAQKRQTPLKVYAERGVPRMCEKIVEEQVQSHIKQFTRKFKGDKKMKHRKRDPGREVSSSRCNISCAMRGRIPKTPNFVALRSQTDLKRISYSRTIGFFIGTPTSGSHSKTRQTFFR